MRPREPGRIGLIAPPHNPPLLSTLLRQGEDGSKSLQRAAMLHLTSKENPAPARHARSAQCCSKLVFFHVFLLLKLCNTLLRLQA